MSIRVGGKCIERYVEPIQKMYGSESLTLNRLVRNFLEAAEIWFCRRILKTPSIDEKSTDRNELIFVSETDNPNSLEMS